MLEIYQNWTDRMENFAQLDQDLWVLERTQNKKGGFFVEAGAMDGIHFSNTFLLEKEFQWGGICCEPNPYYFKQLIENRNCKTDSLVLYNKDDEEVEFFLAGSLGGTEEDFSVERARYEDRKKAEKIVRKTISLNSLLEKHQAPRTIDYISLDTEGSEYRILSTFDFDRWHVRFFSIEHNMTHREDGEEYLGKLISLLSSQGYNHEMNKWDMYFFKDS